MRARTLEEMQAYLDGFNACYEWFEKYLSEVSVEEAMEKMEKLKQAVNSTVRKEELDCNDCYYSMQNCHDRSICCEDETALCDDFEPVVERKEE